MKFYDLNSFYIITDVKEHQQNKMKLLGAINSMPFEGINNNLSEKIIKTDWNIKSDTKRDYYDILFPMIKPYMDRMTEKMKHKTWNINNYWYQIYGKSDEHTWHTHEGVNWASVYYLHLPENGVKTQFYDVKNEKIIDNIQVGEGQIITFPANLLHRSPPNNTDEIKVIIAFNSNFSDSTLTF